MPAQGPIHDPVPETHHCMVRLPTECIAKVFEWLVVTDLLVLRAFCWALNSAVAVRMEMWLSNHGDANLRGVWRPHRKFRALHRLALRCFPCMSRTMLDGIHTVNLTDWDTNVDESLRIASIPGLETLILKDCDNHTQETMSVFLSAPHLRTIDLSCCKFLTDELMAPFGIQGELSIHTLDLRHCGRLTDESMSTISNLSLLRFLDVSFCGQLTDLGAQALSKLSCLRVLKLNGCWKLTAVGISSNLVKLTRLESLELSGCALLTDEAVQVLAGLKYLDHLDISGCHRLTDVALAALSTASQLRSLHLTDCACVTDVGVVHLALFLVELELLSLGNCRRLTSESFLAVATHLAHLQQLTIDGCYFTDTDLAAVARLPLLQLLEARNCICITDSAAEMVSRLAPALQFLR